MASEFKVQKACAGDTKALTKSELKKNADKLAKAMGMGAECSTKAREYISNSLGEGKSSNNFSFGGVMVGAGGIGGFGGSGEGSEAWSEQEQVALDDMATSGCGNFLISGNNIMNKATNVFCKLDSISQSSDTRMSGSASIEISAIIDYNVLETIERMNMRLLERADTLSVEMVQMLQKRIPKSPAGNVNITDSRLRARVSGKMKVINEIDVLTKESIKADMVDIATSAAEAEVSQALTNTQGQEQNTRVVVESMTEDIRTQIEQRSDEVMTNAVAQVDGSASVVISAVGDVNLTNVVIEADTNLELMTSNIMKRAIDVGKEVAQERIVDASTVSTSELESQGTDMAEALRVIGENNANALKIQGDAFKDQLLANKRTGGMWALVQLAVAGAVVMTVIKIVMSRKKKSSRRA